jgi:hypothetical protein
VRILSAFAYVWQGLIFLWEKINMEEILKLIADYGVLMAIAVVFIWDKVRNARTTETVLKELQTASKLQTDTLETLRRSSESLMTALESLRHTSENLTTTLGIIQHALFANTQTMERHSKQADFMNDDIREILAVVRAAAKNEGE